MITDLLFSRKYVRNKDVKLAIDNPDVNIIKPPFGKDFMESTTLCVI